MPRISTSVNLIHFEEVKTGLSNIHSLKAESNEDESAWESVVTKNLISCSYNAFSTLSCILLTLKRRWKLLEQLETASDTVRVCKLSSTLIVVIVRIVVL
jgi:hypothetical protein